MKGTKFLSRISCLLRFRKVYSLSINVNKRSLYIFFLMELFSLQKFTTHSHQLPTILVLANRKKIIDPILYIMCVFLRIAFFFFYICYVLARFDYAKKFRITSKYNAIIAIAFYDICDMKSLIHNRKVYSFILSVEINFLLFYKT